MIDLIHLSRQKVYISGTHSIRESFHLHCHNQSFAWDFPGYISNHKAHFFKLYININIGKIHI